MERVGSYLAYLYLLRVPLLTWFLLVALPFLAVPRRAPFGSMLRGIFDLSVGDTPELVFSFFLVTFVSCMTVAAIGIAARLVLIDGEERFGAGHIPQEPGVRLMYRLISLTAALPLIFFAGWETFRVSVDLNRGVLFVEIAVAVLGGGCFFFWVMKPLHDRLWHLVIERRDLQQFARAHPDLTEQKDKQNRPVAKPNFALDVLAQLPYWLLRAARYVVRWSPAGYVIPQTGKLRNRHSFAVIHLALSLILYMALYFTKFHRVVADFASPTIPTLCLVLVLLMLGCLTLSGLTFFFDRFRIPLLALIAAYATLAAAFPQSDYFYFSTGKTPSAQTKSSLPGDACPSGVGKPMIVVAASGGGIQSAAWTALVLSGLKQDMQDLGNDFDCSIKLISSVSGGSVGAMYFADAYDAGVLPKVTGPLEKYGPVANAEASSLDPVTWGLVYQDVPWSVVPFLRGISISPFSLYSGKNLTNDRGAALERAWKVNDSVKEATLSHWTEDAANGRRPAVVFNATIVETGERLLISTDANFSRQQGAESSNGRRNFTSLYPSADLEVVTAARLSATFPYVSPAGRIWRRNVFAKDYHIVDGGYYDNYGVVSLLDWLDTALRRPGLKPSKVIVLQVRGFPTRATVSPVRHQGSIFQAVQPLETLLRVRDTGQFSHNQVDMELAQRPNVYSVPVLQVDFEFGATDEEGDPIDPPMSWHLTPRDKQVLKGEWGSEHVRRARQKFKDLFTK